MIVQIRGTSGSGKTTAMRRIMEAYKWEPAHVVGRKHPLYYYVNNPKERIVVLGHYEPGVPCGGCDTIGSAPAIHSLIEEVIAANGNIPILTEGLLWSEDTKWTMNLKNNGHKVYAFFLTTSTDTCLARVAQRRADRGNAEPLNPANTTNRVAVIERARLKLLEAGVFCSRQSADQCPKTVLRLLRLHAQRED